ncbi:hypothetical protein J437_LFUL005923 [Ladona fulva]|uniref:C2H2-type domain-containing protein n=1 Tax=Ladona fulva TaxID=123851 RepID=A0A8K0K9Y1_LADFU|nr:hypothetical protein J437_LFUL005923 [Ladona fulva]
MPLLTPREKRMAIDLLEFGESCSEIARRICVAASTISRLKAKWETEHTLERREGQGRPRATTVDQDERLLEIVKENPLCSANEAKEGSNFPATERTARSRIREAGIKPYPCNVCGRRFSQVNALQHHKDSHNTTREFSCTVCHKQFKSSFMLKKHMRSSHADTLSLSQKEEKYVGQNRRYYCNVCGENFAFSVMLKDHESKHQKETNFHCNCCGNNYKSADEFKVHSCNDTEDNKSKEDDPSLKKEVTKNYCELMKRIAKVVHNKVDESTDFQEGGNEQIVIGSDHNVQEPEPGLLQSQSLILGMGESSSIKNEVLEVNKLADIKEENEDAKLNRTNKVSEVCGGFKILRPGDIESTWIVDSNVIACDPHSEGKWMTMPQQEESEIVIYVTPDLHHDVGVKKVTLPASAPNFKKDDIYLNSGLQRNSANLSVTSPVLDEEGCINVQVQSNADTSDGIHFVDLQRYQCKLCGRSFAWKSTLNKHMTNSHQTGPTPKFSCGFCAKEYATSSQVQEHIKRDHYKERPHTCDVCNKTFYKKYDLKIHLRTHTKEKPYICGACGKAFYHLSHIIRHERIHTGERPYKCDDCGREFNQSSSLKTHKIRHSNCSASTNKLDASAKVLIADENLTILNSLPEAMTKNRSPKKSAGVHSVGSEINIDILSSKDANLSFESIPSSYEENGITS